MSKGVSNDNSRFSYLQVSKGVSNDNSKTTGFSHNENSPFSAFHRPSEPTTPPTNGVTIVQYSGQELDARAGSSTAPIVQNTQETPPSATNQNDTESSDDDTGVAEIVGLVHSRHASARPNEPTHARSAYDDDSDDDSEIADIMENARNMEYPILGYRVVMLTPGDGDDDESDEYDDYDYVVDEQGGHEENSDGDMYQEDDGYQGDDDDDDDDDDDGVYDHDYVTTESELDNICEIIQLSKTDACQSPREPWLSVARNMNNGRASSETMDDVMMNCFRPITPVVIKLSPDSCSSDHSIQSTPSVTESDSSASDYSIQSTPSITESKSSLLQFRPIATSSTRPISPDNISADRVVSPLTIDEVHPDDLTAAAVQDQCTRGDKETASKPSLAVNPITSLTEFRASVLVGERLSVRRYEDWFGKSEDEQFAEILEDFLEENEGQLFDVEDNIREMLAHTRDRIAEMRKAIRDARESITDFYL